MSAEKKRELIELVRRAPQPKRTMIGELGLSRSTPSSALPMVQVDEVHSGSAITRKMTCAFILVWTRLPSWTLWKFAGLPARWMCSRISRSTGCIYCGKATSCQR